MAPRSDQIISWEAYEYPVQEKSSDWFWIVGIVGIAGAVTSLVLGNMLFALIILLAATAGIILSMREPDVASFSLLPRGVRINDELIPYSSIDCFCIDEEHRHGPQLFLRTRSILNPFISITIPEDYIDVIDAFLRNKLNEEELDEPFGHRALEFFGF